MSGTKPVLDPPSQAAGFRLICQRVPAGGQYWRIFKSHHPDPLGWDASAESRFSCPNRSSFGVVYVAATFAGALVETLIRDSRDGIGSQAPVRFAEIASRSAVLVKTGRALNLIDLTGKSPLNMGVPSDVLRWSGHAPGRKWSGFFHSHPDNPDGIIYPSRLDGGINLAIYDRALPALVPADVRPLLDWEDEMADAVEQLELAMTP